MLNASVGSTRLKGLRWAALFAAVCGLAMLPCGAMGQVTGTVKKVEEDWELVLNAPSPANTAPQVSCLISPVNHADGVFASLELNHGTLPDFSSGGLQLQAWNGDSWLTVRDYADTTLQNNDEVVTWTMKMWLNDGELTFRVANGNSTSWGAFGSGGNFKLTIDSELSDLNQYNPNVSSANSGIGFGSQRVQKLVLKKVRYYDSAGVLLFEDTAPRVVHQE